MFDKSRKTRSKDHSFIKVPSISKIRFECKKVCFLSYTILPFLFFRFLAPWLAKYLTPCIFWDINFQQILFLYFLFKIKRVIPVYLHFEFDNLQFLVLRYSIMSLERPKKVVCLWMGLVYPTFTKSTFKNWPKIISLLYSKRYIFSPAPPRLHSPFQDFKRKFKME